MNSINIELKAIVILNTAICRSVEYWEKLCIPDHFIGLILTVAFLCQQQQLQLKGANVIVFIIMRADHLLK